VLQEEKQKSSQEPEELLRFDVPEVEETEVYLLKDEEGRIIARTKDELEKKKEEKR